MTNRPAVTSGEKIRTKCRTTWADFSLGEFGKFNLIPQCDAPAGQSERCSTSCGKILTTSPQTFPLISLSRGGDIDPHLTHGSLGTSQHPRRRLDQFSPFAGLTVVFIHMCSYMCSYTCAYTDHATASVAAGPITNVAHLSPGLPQLYFIHLFGSVFQ